VDHCSRGKAGRDWQDVQRNPSSLENEFEFHVKVIWSQSRKSTLCLRVQKKKGVQLRRESRNESWRNLPQKSPSLGKAQIVGEESLDDVAVLAKDCETPQT